MGERQTPFCCSCGVGIGRRGCSQLLYEGLAVVGQQRALQHNNNNNINNNDSNNNNGDDVNNDNDSDNDNNKRFPAHDELGMRRTNLVFPKQSVLRISIRSTCSMQAEMMQILIQQYGKTYPCYPC